MDSKLLCYAKSPIPVINNSSPPNYVIMPALLAHLDYATAKTTPSPSFYSPPASLNASSTASLTSSTSSQALLVQTPSAQIMRNKPANTFKNVRTCSKEIIYKSKRMCQPQPQLDTQYNVNHAHLAGDEMRNVNNSAFSLKSPLNLTMSPPSKHFYHTKCLKTNPRFVKNILISSHSGSSSSSDTPSKNCNYLSSNDRLDNMYGMSSALTSTPATNSHGEHNLVKNYNVIELEDNSASTNAAANVSYSAASSSIGNSFIADSFLNSDVSQHQNVQLNSQNVAATAFSEYSNMFTESTTSGVVEVEADAAAVAQSSSQPVLSLQTSSNQYQDDASHVEENAPTCLNGNKCECLNSV